MAIGDITVNQSKLGGNDIIEDIYRDAEPSPFVSLIQAYALQSSRNSARVIEVCERLLNLKNRSEFYLPPFVEFYMGDALFKLNRFAESIPHFERFVARFEGRSLRAPALVKMGLSHDLLDQRELAISSYEQVTGESEYDIDVFARRTALKYLKAPPSLAEEKLLRATNLHDAGRSKEARALFLDLLDTTEGEVKQVQISYMIGRSYHHEGALSDALGWYERSLEGPFEKNERWIPWSSFYQGEIYEELGDYDESLKCYERALAYKGKYDYKRSLEQKTKAAVSRVKTLGQI